MTAAPPSLEPDHAWALKCAEAWAPGDDEQWIGPAEQNLAAAYLSMRRAPSAEGRLIEDWRKLANISKGCLENAEQEIDQLKTLIREVSAAILAMKDAEGYAKSGDNKTWSAAINRLYSTHRSLDAALRGEP